MLFVKVHFCITAVANSEAGAVDALCADFDRIINELKSSDICAVRYLLVEKPKVRYLSPTIDGIEGYHLRWECSADKESFERLLLMWNDHDKAKLRMYNLHLGENALLF